jgi:hypothetical protein
MYRSTSRFISKLNTRRPLRKFLALCSVTLLLTIGGCKYLGLGESDDNDDLNLLLLLYGWAVLNQNTCQNQSGLVICIPPGLRN